MKIDTVLILSGIVLSLGSAGGVEHLPPTATLGDFAMVIGMGLIGALCVYMGTLCRNPHA